MLYEWFFCKYRDFQELSGEQLKVFFNYMIDHIDIKEISVEDDPRIILGITINMKLDGYTPKYSFEYLKNINTGEEKRQPILFLKMGCQMLADEDFHHRALICPSYKPSRRPKLIGRLLYYCVIGIITCVINL